MRILAGLLLAISMVACTGQVPVPPTASRAQVPAPAPRDAIARIDAATAGVVRLSPSQVAPIQTLQVRMTIAALDAVTLDLRSAVIELPGAGDVTAVIANADIDTLPLIRIDPGERRWVDLYFALPPGLDTSELGPFEVRAILTSASSELAWHAALDALAPATHTLGRSARWWLDPTYAWPLSHRRDGVIAVRTPTTVAITSAASR